jgi:hypothetical protein
LRSQLVRVMRHICHHFGDDARGIVTTLDTRHISGLVT